MISTILSATLHKGGQSVSYIALHKAVSKDKKEHKLKFSIKSDSFPHQSYARVERFNGEEWMFLVNVSYSQMKTPHGMVSWPAERKITGENFMEDVKELHRLSGLILD